MASPAVVISRKVVGIQLRGLRIRETESSRSTSKQRSRERQALRKFKHTLTMRAA